MTQRRLVTVFLLGLGAMGISLSACSQKPEPDPLPTEPVTLTGTLLPVELSAVRRGTHVLSQNGKETTYVESTTVNLRAFERMRVAVHGMMQHNTDTSFLPVLVADEATSMELPPKTWELPALKLTLQAPVTWNGTVFPDGVKFSVTGSLHPIVTIASSALTRLPTGSVIDVGGQRAVRAAPTASGSEVTYVQRGETILAFSFTPGKDDVQKVLDTQEYLRMLRSVSFLNMAHSATSKSSGSAASAGQPCGGVAGVLCPAGYYCNIIDSVNGNGFCRKLP